MGRLWRIRSRIRGTQRRRSRSRSQCLHCDRRPTDGRREEGKKDAGLSNPPFKKNVYTIHPYVEDRSSVANELWLEEEQVRVKGREIPYPVWSFEEAGIPARVLQKLDARFDAPTPVQAQALPIALSGRDMIGIASTGSGKTLSFILPALVHVHAQEPLALSEGPAVLILIPTRELALQLNEVTLEMCPEITRVAVFGGGPRTFQSRELLCGVQMVIATPGRLLDFLEAGEFDLKRCSLLVIDEADYMLNLGFEPQIRRIVKYMKPAHQTLMWSATWPKEVRHLAENFLHDYIQVNVGPRKLAANDNIHQIVEVCLESEKEEKLVSLLKKLRPDKNNKVIVFTQTIDRVEEVMRITQERYDAVAIHREKTGIDRDFILKNFRNGKPPILVATDIVARGLDVDVRYVVNFDFPKSVELYVHRIGRTGRSKNSKGTSYTFFTRTDANMAAKLVSVLEESKQKVDSQLKDLSKEYKVGNIHHELLQWNYAEIRQTPGGLDLPGGRHLSSFERPETIEMAVHKDQDPLVSWRDGRKYESHLSKSHRRFRSRTFPVPAPSGSPEKLASIPVIMKSTSPSYARCSPCRASCEPCVSSSPAHTSKSPVEPHPPGIGMYQKYSLSSSESSPAPERQSKLCSVVADPSQAHAAFIPSVVYAVRQSPVREISPRRHNEESAAKLEVETPTMPSRKRKRKGGHSRGSPSRKETLGRPARARLSSAKSPKSVDKKKKHKKKKKQSKGEKRKHRSRKDKEKPKDQLDTNKPKRTVFLIRKRRVVTCIPKSTDLGEVSQSN